MKKIYTWVIAALLLGTAGSLRAQSFSESFEGATFPPTGWTRINAGTGNTWSRIASNGYAGVVAQDGGFWAGVSYHPSNPMNTWLITPAQNLTAGTSYTLTFFYRVAADASGVYPEKMKVTVGNAATVAAQTTVLWDNNGGASLTNTAWQQGTINFTPTSTGTYYFGFNGYSDADKWVLALDNIRLEVTPTAAPTCTTNTVPANNATGVNIYPNLVLNWNAVPGASSYDVYIGTTNPPTSLVTTSSTNSVSLVGGAYNTTYYWYVVPKNSLGAATGCASSTTSFTTKQAPPAPSCPMVVSPANGATGVSNNPITLTWTSSPNATAYDLYLGTASSWSGQPLVEDITDTTIDLTGGAFDSTYYWLIIPKNENVEGVGCDANIWSFTLRSMPPTPANDNCAGAVAISPYTGVVDGYTYNATASPSVPACPNGGSADDDVWYSFVALRNGGATISAVGNNFNPMLQAFSGTCGSLTQIGTCANATGTNSVETLTLTGLVGGQTYYLRVYDTSSVRRAYFSLAIGGDALPVEISDFKGVKEGAANRLSWSTRTEQNSSGFYLERSADGRSYSSLTFVASKAENGNSSLQLNYSFVDNQPFAGNSYYRLKQVDKDGKFTYSDVVVLKGDKLNTVVIGNVYPNPVRNNMNVILSAPSNEKVNLVITDLAGKVVKQQSLQLKAGDNSVSLDVNALPSGNYLIKAICASGCQTAVSKFVKQ